MADLDYEVTGMGEKLDAIEEALPDSDDVSDALATAIHEAQWQWKEVKKAAEETESALREKQGDIDDLKAELDEVKQNYADDDESADKREAALQETIAELEGKIDGLEAEVADRTESQRHAEQQTHLARLRLAERAARRRD